MAMQAQLPPRVLELFHEVFGDFARQFWFPAAQLRLLSVACFVACCKVE